MTVKRAIKILDWCITLKTELKEGLLNPHESWNDDEFTRRFAKGLADHIQIDTEILEKIRKELVSNCKHPKNMRDKSGDVWYCMNCNQDL